MTSVGASLPDVLQERLASVDQERTGLEAGYQLGDLVHMKGKLKTFRNNMELVANYHSMLKHLTKLLL